MVDPTNFTNYNYSDFELEEVALFSILVPGKNATQTVKNLEKLMQRAKSGNLLPFARLRFPIDHIERLLIECGFGCYKAKSKAVYDLVNSNLNLRTCGIEDLESLYGCGPKTARMFVLHTRPNVEVAVLDTHVLKYLKDKGHVVPKSTPNGKKYEELERIFLQYAKQSGKTVAAFDLEIWNYFSKRRAS